MYYKYTISRIDPDLSSQGVTCVSEGCDKLAVYMVEKSDGFKTQAAPICDIHRVEVENDIKARAVSFN